MHRKSCRLAPCWVAVLCAVACAQTTGADPELARAQARVDEVRKQVEAGASPRVKLEEAEADLADARDADFLRHTLYGEDLTEEDSAAVLAAAGRRLERRRARLEEAKRLVEAGGAPRLSLSTPLEELDAARREVDLAESRARLVHELAEMARAEAAAVAPSTQPAEPGPVAERFDGDGSFTQRDLKSVILAFEDRFAKPLPISARGETALHRALGFDHRDRVDVALHPDTPEGLWLRDFLELHHIPYFAFRNYVRGKATAAHIHIGPPSTRLARGSS